MDRSDIQESLFTLYLRLNGYFVTGFIVHASQGNRSELDDLAVRFPLQQEPDREIKHCPFLKTSDSQLDFLVCEVKGGLKNINFNESFRGNPTTITSVLQRIGAFSNGEISSLVPQIQGLLQPQAIQESQEFPAISIPCINARLRFILVAPDQTRSVSNKHKPYIYGDDMIAYIWQCFRPESPRQNCAVSYNKNLWGEQYRKFVDYFKDKNRPAPGNINDIYAFFGL